MAPKMDGRSIGCRRADITPGHRADRRSRSADEDLQLKISRSGSPDQDLQTKTSR